MDLKTYASQFADAAESGALIPEGDLNAARSIAEHAEPSPLVEAVLSLVAYEHSPDADGRGLYTLGAHEAPILRDVLASDSDSPVAL